MNKKELKLVFMGTPEFSAKILQGIVNDGYNIVGVITEPDKPTGRKMEILPTPVKKFAIEKRLEVFQPEKKINVFEVIDKLKPDLVVVAAYGKIITKETIEVPKYGCINFHGSLLPELRGASPIQTAILRGLSKTGVTIMLMDEGMDTGPIITQVEIELDGKETTSTLREKMLDQGLPLLLETLPKYIDGEIKPIPQDKNKASYCKMIAKEDGKIDFSQDAESQERKIRAFNEWPGVYSFFGEKRLKILEVDGNFRLISSEQFSNKKIGEVFLGDGGSLCIKFKNGIWVIKKLQLESSKETDAKSFLNGHKDFVGSILK